MALLVKGAALYAPASMGPGSVLVEGAKIVRVYGIGEATPDVETVDLGGVALGPGLIDVHAHGADQVELMEGGDAALRMARFYARHGVTAFLPATVTASFEDIARAVESVRRAQDRAWGRPVMEGAGGGSPGDKVQPGIPMPGARVLGVHLEGPFVSPERLGAQSPEFCLAPTADHVARLLDIAGDVTRIVTLAPEEEGGIEAVRTLVGRGIVTSVGHTVATAEQAEEAFAAGATQVTHMFNGMPPMHHRRPGIVGAALTARGVRVEVIADGVHVAPAAVRLILAAKGVDEMILITDSIAATGCADGEYRLGPMQVYVRDGQARLASGNLAGSTLTLERAVVNVARWTEAGLAGAWQMASLNPARQLGIDDRCGRLAPGYDADLTALDANGRAVWTMVGGCVVG